MRASAGGVVLFLSSMVAAAAAAATYDKGLSSSTRAGLQEKTLVLSFQGVAPPRRAGAFSPSPHHLILSLAFPGHNRFAIILDRSRSQVVLETVVHGETATLRVRAPPVKPRAVVRSVVVEVNQESSLATVYVNCRLMGTVTLPKVPREMAAHDPDQDLRVYRERQVEASVDWNITVLEILDKLGCPTDGDTGQVQAQANEVYTYRRGDIPIIHEDEASNKLVKTLAELIETIKELQIEIQTQREETALLRDALLNCEACKPAWWGVNVSDAKEWWYHMVTLPPTMVTLPPTMVTLPPLHFTTFRTSLPTTPYNAGNSNPWSTFVSRPRAGYWDEYWALVRREHTFNH